MKVLKVIDAIKPLVNPHSVLDVLAVIETLRVSEVITGMEAKAASHVICNYQAEDRVHWFAELEQALRAEELKLAIREAVAQGWCTKANRGKLMDADLAMDISGIVFDLVRDRILKTRLGAPKVAVTYPKSVSRIAAKVFRERLMLAEGDKMLGEYPGSEHEFQSEPHDIAKDTNVNIVFSKKRSPDKMGSVPEGIGKGRSIAFSDDIMTEEDLMKPTASQMGLSSNLKDLTDSIKEKDNDPL